jgi:CHAD domain-containing protein
MSTHPETEFKLRATQPIAAADVERLLQDFAGEVRAEATRRHVDEYLDDDAGSLAAAGVGLRLRRSGGEARLCSKRGSRGVDGLFEREECEVEWPHPAPPQTAAELPAELRARIEPWTLDRPLAPRLQLTTRREVRALARDGRVHAVVCVDATEAAAGDGRVQFDEVEIEVTSPADVAECRELAEQLRAGLPLQFAEDDKPTHARALLLGGAPALGADSPHGGALGGVVARAVRRDVAALQAAEAAMRVDRTPESLHALRVVLRRLRSLVRGFRDLWPAAGADAALAWLAESSRRCGELRDLDVGLAGLRAEAERLPGALHDGAAAALAWAEAQRAEVAARLHAWFGEPERLRQQRDCCAALAALDPHAVAAAAQPADELARRLGAAAARLHKRVKAIADDLPTPALHELRIAGKRLRYLAEAFADELVDVPKKAVARLARLQQTLGAVCDHENALARLVGWLQPAAAASQDGVLAAAAIGALAARHAAAARKARKAARRALRRIDRKRFWRALQAESATGGGDDGGAAPADANLSP